MEEAPLVSDWKKLTKTPNVVVVPFFVSDGLHSYEDIPVLLGIPSCHPERSEAKPKDPAAKPLQLHEIPRLPLGMTLNQAGAKSSIGNPYKIDGRFLFYANAIGTGRKICRCDY